MTAANATFAPASPLLPEAVGSVPATGFREVVGWWRAICERLALDGAIVCLEGASPHLLSDIGMAGHRLTSRRLRDAEQARQVTQLTLVGRW